MMRFIKVAAVLLAVGAVAQLHHSVDGTASRWTDTRAARVNVGPYDVAVPAGWRDANELAIPELRAHAVVVGATVLVPDATPMRGDTVEIAWRPVTLSCAETIHVGDEAGCMSLFDGKEEIAIRHGDRELVLRGDVGAIDEALAGVRLHAAPAPAPAPVPIPSV